ncbi:unnamed protein product [Mytilus coruscus]|uniref:Uncharacterized protein n=1 Tax=Mytilus coruscus TaxID=42192 RepID=A0A6J8F2F3_MYTCO|nr:unnamed protein product [Mytilus coruscus]
MREDTRDFTRDKYFNGHQNTRKVEENWNMIKEFILGTTNTNVPTKTSKGKQSIPWINNNIKAMIKRKNRRHANYKKNNRKYINNQKADKQGIPPLKTQDSKTAYTDQQKAEALNIQFTSVYTKTEYESIPHQTPLVDKMRNITVTTKGVEKILKNLNALKRWVLMVYTPEFKGKGAKKSVDSSKPTTSTTSNISTATTSTTVTAPVNTVTSNVPATASQVNVTSSVVPSPMVISKVLTSAYNLDDDIQFNVHIPACLPVTSHNISTTAPKPSSSPLISTKTRVCIEDYRNRPAKESHLPIFEPLITW